MISLHQDAQGFIRMKRHFPASTEVSVVFADGTEEVFTAQRLNQIYDEALAAYRAANHLDAKGFVRGPKKKVQQGIEFVPVSPGMSG
ncbi:hypothetical protein [Arthrobacter sp. ISL-95]|uniref:hypothetical protein n=1 Tax=Arthrobacter sp. ISL-95 TaxID=2819116 RepID=UPI001BE592C9|nr:hypothetical protein [Arthrobacter sp. ISL-95]MBT2586432.1 hypothetical protein [Arthrobacter sp. ISL-95]